jgi:hypothetical protein
MNFTEVLNWPRSKPWQSTTMDLKVIKYDGELKVITPFEKTGFEISSPRMRE